MKLVSKENGRNNIEEAATLRGRHDVISRIATAKQKENNFCYHVKGKCYKLFTNKKTTTVAAKIRKIEIAEVIDDQIHLREDQPGTSRQTRSNQNSGRSFARSHYDKNHILYDVKCIICDVVKCNQEQTKFRISTYFKANLFVVAVKRNDDDVTVRLADIDDLSRLLASDIYYHPNCMKPYMNKFERKQLCLICKSPASRKEYSLDEPAILMIRRLSLEKKRF